MKIKFKLSIMIIAIMVVVVAGLSFLILRQSSNISLDLSLTGIKYLANHQAEYWKGREDGYIRMLRTLANIMSDYEDIEPSVRRNRFDDMLIGTLSSDPVLLTVYTVWRPNAIDGLDAQFIGRAGSTVSGQYAATCSRETGTIEIRASIDIKDSMRYFNGPNSKKARVDDPFSRNINGTETNIIRMMVPIINPRTNETVGGVGCLLSSVAIQAGLEQCIRDYNEITAMAIYSGNGFIFGHFLPNRIGKMLVDVDVEYGANKQAAFNAVQGGTDFEASVYDPTLDTSLELVLTSFQIGDSDQHWAVMIAATKADVLRPVQKITRFVVIIASIAIIVTATVIFLVLAGMTKPIVRVTDTLKDIAEGEGDLTRSIVINSKDEVGDLARYFNETLEKIKSLVLTIKKQGAALFDIGNDLASSMTETAAAVNEITANIQSIKGRVINQSASVTETNATMEQITMNIDKLSGHVEQQTSSVAQSSSAIEQMLANIQSVTRALVKNAENVQILTEASEVGRTGLQDVAADIQEISRESEGLLEINAVMENIASQTNLLSMNAAIEAAHAGEAGKGFAVVADEIRKLAESSGEQSKTISAVLKKITGSIDKITQSTGNVLKKFEAIDGGVKTVAEQEENIRNAMEEQGQGSKQILEAIEQVSEITQQVKDESTEMLKGSKEIIDESKNLDLVTQEISGGMNEMAAGAEQINGAVNQVNEISGKNKESIEYLMKEVARFKVE